jgi:hypothetical protein
LSLFDTDYASFDTDREDGAAAGRGQDYHNGKFLGANGVVPCCRLLTTTFSCSCLFDTEYSSSYTSKDSVDEQDDGKFRATFLPMASMAFVDLLTSALTFVFGRYRLCQLLQG